MRKPKHLIFSDDLDKNYKVMEDYLMQACKQNRTEIEMVWKDNFHKIYSKGLQGKKYNPILTYFEDGENCQYSHDKSILKTVIEITKSTDIGSILGFMNYFNHQNSDTMTDRTEKVKLSDIKLVNLKEMVHSYVLN